MTETVATSIADDRFRSDQKFTSLRGLTAAARHHLSESVWNYLWAGTGDEVTTRRNTEKFDEVLWEVPMYAGVSNPSTATTFMGLDLALPVITAPFGQEAVFHPDGHLAVGRAVAEAGTAQMVPVAASYTLEEIAEASDRALFFQMTMVGDEDMALELAARARDAGYRFIVATYSPIRQWRERLIEDRFVPRGVRGHVNFGPGRSDPAPFRELVDFTEPRWTWERLASFVRRCPLPVLVKGVHNDVDATASMEAGAAGLYVSNYGGRTIDRTHSAIEALPEVRAAIGPDVPIVFDSGVRRGADVAAALALGADVVAIGRLTAVGLAADGQAGVSRLLDVLREELWTTLGHLGCSTIDQLGPHHIRAHPVPPAPPGSYLTQGGAHA